MNRQRGFADSRPSAQKPYRTFNTAPCIYRVGGKLVFPHPTDRPTDEPAPSPRSDVLFFDLLSHDLLSFFSVEISPSCRHPPLSAHVRSIRDSPIKIAVHTDASGKCELARASIKTTRQFQNYIPHVLSSMLIKNSVLVAHHLSFKIHDKREQRNEDIMFFLSELALSTLTDYAIYKKSIIIKKDDYCS